MSSKKTYCILGGLLGGLCAAGVAAHWFLFERVDYAAGLVTNPVSYAAKLFNEGCYKDAEDYIVFYQKLPLVSGEEASKLDPILAEVRAKRSSLSYKAEQAARGFLQGDSDEEYGQWAEFAAELVGYGDFRDLYEAGQKYANDEEYDELTVALSTVGAAITIWTLSSAGASTAATLPVKAGMAVVKTAKRAKKLAKSFEESVIAGARLVTQEPKETMFATAGAELGKPLIELGEYAMKDGVGNSIEVLAKARSVKELPHVIKGAQIFGKEAGAVLRFSGPDVLKAAEKTSAKEVLEASKYGPKAVSELTKTPAKRLLADLAHYTKIAGSSTWRLIKTVLWIADAILGVLAIFCAFAAIGFLKRAVGKC